MNIDNIVKIEGAFNADILRILHEIPGVIVNSVRPTNNEDFNAVIEFAGERKGITVQYKKRIDAAIAWQFVKESETFPLTPLLVIAGSSTTESRAILRDHGVSLADDLGNVHIQLPGLLVHLEGSPRRRSSIEIQIPKLRGKSGVLAQVLLIYHRKSWHVNELAEEADTSVGLAHRVLNRLEKEKVVTSDGSGPKKVRRVVDPRALLDLWTEEEKSKPVRSQGFVLAQTPQKLIEKVAGALQEAEIDHALTGAAAASLIKPFVTAIPVIELWITALAMPENIFGLIGGEMVGEGANISLLQERDDTPLVFREKVEGKWISNYFRIYLDLLRDPRRGREQAMNFRSEVIGF